MAEVRSIYRDRETEIDRQRDRQAEIDRQIKTYRERQERDRYRQINMQIDRQTDRQKETDRDRQIDKKNARKLKKYPAIFV